jgi:Arc/MetJ-type ribon-helix-helix transcriptional regulator
LAYGIASVILAGLYRRPWSEKHGWAGERSALGVELEVRACPVWAASSERRGMEAMRYDPGMTRVAKITISLPQEQVEQAQRAVANGEASSVSGYISAALAAVNSLLTTDEQDTLTAFAADLIAEDGEPSAEAYARADRFLAMSESD